jgi:hypothetical protein
MNRPRDGGKFWPARTRHAARFASVLVVVLSFTSAALADSTVHLKSGGFVRGEVMEVQPEVVVRVRLADGTVREIPWADLARIEDEAPPPPPPPPPVPPATLAWSSLPERPPPENSARIQELRRERDDINNTGPVVLMIVGGLGFLIFFLPGLILLAAGDTCDSVDPDYDCGDFTGVGAAFTVIGVVGGAAAIYGFVKVLDNGKRRRAIDSEIVALKEQAFRLDIAPRAGGGELRLAWRF